MASSYIGLHVSLALNDSQQPLVGTITQIDVERNLLVLSRQGGGEPVQVDKTRIRGISVVPAPAPTTNDHAATAAGETKSQPTAPAMASNASASSSSNGAGATDFRAPEAAKLPKPSRGGRAVGHSNESNGVSTSSGSTSRRKKKGKKAGSGGGAGAAQGPHTSDEGREHDQGHGHTRASSSLSEDFDFEASAKHFDKAAIWEQIRAQDRSDPAALLVSHNRRGGDAAAGGDLGRGRSGTPVGMGDGGKMRKLRIDENVLSPSPEEEKSEEKGGLAVQTAAVTEVPSVQQPAPALTSTTSGARSGADSEALQRENASLRRRLYILESLSGLSIQDHDHSTSSVGTDQQVEFQVALAPPALPGSSPAPTPGQSSPVTFYLQTSLEPSDPKLRFKPTSNATATLSAASNGSSSGSGSGKLPEKYNREMGLRLDNGSARVFMERLRGAL